MVTTGEEHLDTMKDSALHSIAGNTSTQTSA